MRRADGEPHGRKSEPQLDREKNMILADLAFDRHNLQLPLERRRFIIDEAALVEIALRISLPCVGGDQFREPGCGAGLPEVGGKARNLVKKAARSGHGGVEPRLVLGMQHLLCRAGFGDDALVAVENGQREGGARPGAHDGRGVSQIVAADRERWKLAENRRPHIFFGQIVAET